MTLNEFDDLLNKRLDGFIGCLMINETKRNIEEATRRLFKELGLDIEVQVVMSDILNRADVLLPGDIEELIKDLTMPANERAKQDSEEVV